MKKQTVRKPSKLDAVSTSVAQDYAHRDTGDIIRQRRVIVTQVDMTDAEIAVLAGRLVDARAQRAKLGAMLVGLASVIDKR